MALGTWRSPFPHQLGGQSVARISRIYDGLRSNIGDALNTEQGTIAGGELVAGSADTEGYCWIEVPPVKYFEVLVLPRATA